MSSRRRFETQVIFRWALALAMGALLLPLRSSGDVAPLDPSIVTRSLVSMGDTARLQHVLAKARRGEKVVVAVIGGSITAGAKASTPELCYGALIADWWRKSFPNTEIEFINAGIGATGSDIGAHRAQAHLLSHNPDFVVVEYAVNDGPTPAAAETLEGLARQILKQPNQPAVMLLFMMNKSGGNAQEFHETIGRHYELPMTSFRDALWPEVQAGRIPWETFEADEVHPNDRGHQYCADFVTNVLEKVRASLPEDAALPPIKPLPSPKTSDTFEFATFFNADTLKPLRNEGWTVDKDPGFGGLFGSDWRSSTPGSVLEFQVEGSAVGLMFYRIKGDMGIAEVSVDGGAPVKLDAWFEADWGGYTAFNQVARDLTPGPHQVRITLLDEKNPGSTGHNFRLHAIMVAGKK